MSVYVLTPLAKADIFDIWSYIADDSEGAADRVERAIYDACAFLAEAPMRGHTPPRLYKPFASFLDVNPLSQLRRCVPARDRTPSDRCRPPWKNKYTAHSETARADGSATHPISVHCDDALEQHAQTQKLGQLIFPTARAPTRHNARMKHKGLQAAQVAG
jgi:plasmid stabilization system protein ParE